MKWALIRALEDADIETAMEANHALEWESLDEEQIRAVKGAVAGRRWLGWSPKKR